MPLNSAMRFNCATFVTGNMPARIGSFEPRADKRSTSAFHLSTSKKNCVVANDAPAFSLRSRTSISSSKFNPDAGCPSGNAATPIVNPPTSAASVTNSSA